MTASLLYPVALDLQSKRCVVVGGGDVGARRVVGLMEAGADVLVVAPETGEILRELIAAGSVRYAEEPFRPDHLDNAFLVIAATDNPEVNRRVADAARARGTLLGLAAPASDPVHAADFVTMATIRRGEMLVAITTGGAGPALTARLRRTLEPLFGPEWGPYTELLREMREQVRTSYSDEKQRGAALRRLAECDEVRVCLAAGDNEGARRKALAICLS